MPVGCIQDGYSKAGTVSACGSRSKNGAILHTFEGTDPLNEFLSKAKTFRFAVSSPNDSGIPPTREFLLKSMTLANTSELIDDGTVPTKQFTLSARFCIYIKLPIEFGIDPVKELTYICIVRRFVRLPTLDGIDP